MRSHICPHCGKLIEGKRGGKHIAAIIGVMRRGNRKRRTWAEISRRVGLSVYKCQKINLDVKRKRQIEQCNRDFIKIADEILNNLSQIQLSLRLRELLGYENRDS